MKDGLPSGWTGSQGPKKGMVMFLSVSDILYSPMITVIKLCCQIWYPATQSFSARIARLTTQEMIYSTTFHVRRHILVISCICLLKCILPSSVPLIHLVHSITHHVGSRNW